jgi:hypothetical protein
VIGCGRGRWKKKRDVSGQAGKIWLAGEARRTKATISLGTDYYSLNDLNSAPVKPGPPSLDLAKTAGNNADPIQLRAAADEAVAPTGNRRGRGLR